MELAIYIKNLLYNHDKVIVPGLGILQTVYKPAQINSDGRTISPPSKSVVFNEELALSDGLLAGFLVTHKNIDKATAENFIAQQVTSFIQKLDAGETICMEGIGYFSKDNKVLRFEPEKEANFLTDSFGLSKIDYNPIEFKLSSKQTQKSVKSYKKKSYALLIIILLIVIIIGGGIATYFYFPEIVPRLKNFINKHSVTEVSKNIEAIPIPKKDTVKTNELEKSVDISTDKKTALSIKNTVEAPRIKENLSFYIIAGSFKTFERASILAKQLKKEGYKPEVIQFDQELFRVSLGEFKDRTQADTEFNKIKTKKGAEAVWLLKKNL